MDSGRKAGQREQGGMKGRDPDEQPGQLGAEPPSAGTAATEAALLGTRTALAFPGLTFAVGVSHRGGSSRGGTSKEAVRETGSDHKGDPRPRPQGLVVVRRAGRSVSTDRGRFESGGSVLRQEQRAGLSWRDGDGPVGQDDADRCLLRAGHTDPQLSGAQPYADAPVAPVTQ